MTLQQKIETLIEAITALPGKGQAEILRSLAESQGYHLGIDDFE